MAVLAWSVGFAGCRATTTAVPETRENAYKANNLGVAQLEQFNYAEAADAFRQALQIDGSLTIAHVNLSIALLYAQDLAGAAREANEAARAMPREPQPAYILGLIARTEKLTADAVREFERVRQIDPNDVGTLVNLGQIYLEQRQYLEAIAVLRSATNAEPYNVTAAYNLGLALTRSGASDEGRQTLDRAQALRGTGYAVTYGTGYLEQGRYAEAIASSGSEPALVDAAVPAVSFSLSAIGSATNPGTPMASPLGRQFSAAELTPAGGQQIAAAMSGCVTVLDADHDGDLDLFHAAFSGQRLFRNDGSGRFVESTDSAGLTVSGTLAPIGCLAADYDNDGLADLFVLRYGASTLYRNIGQGRFADSTRAARLPAYDYLPGAAAWVDVDHDGDVDLLVAGLADLTTSRGRAAQRPLTFPDEFEPAPVRLLRNNGNGTFSDITDDARIATRTRAVAIVPTDFDNGREVDLLIANRAMPSMLFKNLRDGTFRDVASEVGLAAAIGNALDLTAVTAADVNKDDFPDVYFARSSGGSFALSNGTGRFTAAAGLAAARAGVAVQFVDYDADGLFDLLLWTADRPQLLRNVGREWNEVTARALTAIDQSAADSAREIALADVTGDGRTDIITGRGASLTLWRNGDGDERRTLRVALQGRVSNRLAVGSKIQIRAGSLHSRIETSSTTPPIAPADVVFGLGRRAGADAIRALWPSGILQAEVRSPALPPQLVLEELDRKPSSCPFLFAWNGRAFEFVTDFMGGGEMGYWEGPGQRNTPDPVEYVRIDGSQLKPKDGRFELRITNELEETLFADRMQLLAVTHPSEVAVYPNEGMTIVPKPFDLFVVENQRVPDAIDDHGHDITDRLARIDRKYPDDFRREPIRGYAAQHWIELDLAPVSVAPMLLLTGWTDYAFSSDNVAAFHAGRALSVPSLQVEEVSGRWRTIVADIGIPVGRPQTVTVDLAGRLRPDEHVVRIVTDMRVYWDRALVGNRRSDVQLQTVAIDASAATLRERGFSAEIRPDGQDPPGYDYARVGFTSAWKVMPGRYTRTGDVRPLLLKADDQFVVAKPGDEIALTFDDPAADRIPAGWTRTFLVVADGFSKEMDINSASPHTVDPLPFHAMRSYPYHWPEHYPDSPEHQRYQLTYNTRVVVRSVPHIDTLLPLK